jgi:SOS response regulatory protein OraA/RecX
MEEKIRILKLSRSASEVSVTISALDEPVVVPEHIVHKHSLKENIVITPSQLEMLRTESELFLCDRTAARMLAVREHSTGEIRTKLARKSFTPDAIRRIIRKYKDRGVLDDARYAHRLANQLLKQRPCGRAYLVACLQRKKIDRSLAELTAEETLAGKDEKELAKAALGKRWNEYSQFELEVARRKSYNYLARRGFGYEAARAAFEQLLERRKEVPRD